ncbi:hypothetical protein OAT67_02140 [Bacteriovoracaceae bacterium]|nr:hypothetical protein [Bacteriovoracaceae bacterium]|tara:strand:- start:7425 stop:7970 length:546 start_codon:yes stop_codon:yes gene_type:complete
MAYLLRVLILLMIIGIGLTVSKALGWLDLGYSHIQLAIVSFLYTIFAQAFVMFYFIGVSRLVMNVYEILHGQTNLNELFDDPPADLEPYLKKVKKFAQDADRCKRQTIPWTMLILVLGSIAFLLGGAHDTHLVSKTTHSGVVYGFVAALIIGFFRQWHYLKVGHVMLRKLKTLFEIPDGQM